MLVRNVLLGVVVAGFSFSTSGAQASDPQAPVKVAALSGHRAKLPPLQHHATFRTTGPESTSTRAVGVIEPIRCEIVGSDKLGADTSTIDASAANAHLTQSSPFHAQRSQKAFVVLTFKAHDGFAIDNARLKVFPFANEVPTPDATFESRSLSKDWKKQMAIEYCVANDEWFPITDDGLRIHLFKQGDDVYAKIPYCYSSATIKLKTLAGSAQEYRIAIPIQITKSAEPDSKYALVSYRQLDHTKYAVGDVGISRK